MGRSRQALVLHHGLGQAKQGSAWSELNILRVSSYSQHLQMPHLGQYVCTKYTLLDRKATSFRTTRGMLRAWGGKEVGQRRAFCWLSGEWRETWLQAQGHQKEEETREEGRARSHSWAAVRSEGSLHCHSQAGVFPCDSCPSPLLTHATFTLCPWQHDSPHCMHWFSEVSFLPSQKGGICAADKNTKAPSKVFGAEST